MQSIGLKTSGQDLKAMLEKTGFNMKKCGAVLKEKLDLLEQMEKQILNHLEMGGRCHLTLSCLIDFLEKEGMAPVERSGRCAVLSLEALRCRERKRLGYHVSAEELEGCGDALAVIPDYLEDALAAIPDSELSELFDSEGRRQDSQDADDAFDVVGRRRDSNAQTPCKHRASPMLEDASLAEVAPEERILAHIRPEATRQHLLVLGLKDRSRSRSRSRSHSRKDKLQAPQTRDAANDDLFDSAGQRRDFLVDSSTNASLMLEDTSPAKVAKEERILERINPEAIRQHLPVLGLEGHKDELAKIRGIGHWIERRLNRIKIWNFQQLARMTPTIAADVAKAIRYFPGRISHDQWVYQAERLADGREWIVNPPITRSGSSSIIMVKRQKYDRELIDIARHYDKEEGPLKKEHAECLWFSAMDGRVVTALERLTIRYILDNFKFDDVGRRFLDGKLDITQA